MIKPTAKYLSEYLKNNGTRVESKAEESYYLVEWPDLHRAEVFGKDPIFYEGDVLGNDLHVYHTFTVMSSREEFEPFAVAIKA